MIPEALMKQWSISAKFHASITKCSNLRKKKIIKPTSMSVVFTIHVLTKIIWLNQSELRKTFNVPVAIQCGSNSLQKRKFRKPLKSAQNLTHKLFDNLSEIVVYSVFFGVCVLKGIAKFTGVLFSSFLWILWTFTEHVFDRIPPNDCFWSMFF